MKIGNVSAQNFNGKLYVVNKLSRKPARCVLKEKSNLFELVRKEKFDLFIKQNYSDNKIHIIATSKSEPQISVSNDIPVTAKHSQYFDAAKKSIENYKTVRYNYLYKEHEKSLTLKDKFIDMIYNALSVIVWG